VERSSFITNRATATSGGAVHTSDDANVTIILSTFDANKAVSSGGALQVTTMIVALRLAKN
jgi:predicted outer membrane repeat protein